MLKGKVEMYGYHKKQRTNEEQIDFLADYRHI